MPTSYSIVVQMMDPTHTKPTVISSKNEVTPAQIFSLNHLTTNSDFLMLVQISGQMISNRLHVVFLDRKGHLHTLQLLHTGTAQNHTMLNLITLQLGKCVATKSWIPDSPQRDTPPADSTLLTHLH